MAKVTESTTFTSATAGNSVSANGDFNLHVDFTNGSGVGTVALQRSYDGSTWYNIESYTADTFKIVENPEGGVKHRLNCTAYTSGSIFGRISN